MKHTKISHSSRTRVLLAHQDALLAAGIAATLTADDEFEVMLPDTGSDASIAEAWRSADVAIADYHTALEQMREGDPDGRVLIFCREAGEARVLLALKLGALTNAFRHAAARRIDVEIRYSRKGLSLRVVDDVVGSTFARSPAVNHRSSLPPSMAKISAGAANPSGNSRLWILSQVGVRAPGETIGLQATIN